MSHTNNRTLHSTPAALAAGLLLLTLLVLPGCATTGTTGGGSSSSGKSGAIAQTWQDIEVPPLPDQEVPTPRRIELDNGMVVILLEDHELPLVEATALIRTGTRLETADKAGLPELTGTVLRTGGTTSMTPADLDEFLEDRAASVETGIGTTSGSASMSALTQDYPEVLKVFADVLRNPAFEEDKLEVAKTQQRAGIARQNDDPQDIAFREFRELIYGGDSSYALANTYQSIDNVSREDLVAWHERYYHPNRVILGLVGDFDSDEALAQVREAFGDWQRGPAVPADEVSGLVFDEADEAGIYYVEKSDMTQSNIVIGHLGVEKDHPDYYAIEALNNILSGSFASRLFTNVRSAKGLAYAVFGSIGSNYDYPGVFTMFTSTKTETTAAAIDALIEEAENLTAKPPTEEELDKAKEAILKSFVFQSDSMREILGQQLSYEYFGYPLDWLERYREGIDNVTLEEVRAAAKHVRPEDFAILVVGPKEGLDRPLSEFGEVIAVDISIPEPAAQRAEMTEAGRARAMELAAMAVEAMGGAEAVDAVTGLRATGTVQQVTPQGEMEIAVVSTHVFPDRVRQELTLPMGSFTMVTDGDSGFMTSPQGTMDLPASRAATSRRSAMRDPLLLLQMRQDPAFSAVALEPVVVDGQPVERLEVEIDGDVTVVGLDAESGRVRQLVFREQGPTGAPGEVVQTFSDWRPVDDLTYPFAIDGTFDGERMSSTRIQEIEVSPQVDDSAFAKPE